MQFSNFEQQILSAITRSLDPSAVAGGWKTMDLFGPTTIVTATTTTGQIVSVKDSSSQTIFVDITGLLASGTGASTGATGIILTLRAGLSGFGFITVRSTTAGLGQWAWKVGAAGVNSGTTADCTGVTRYDDLFLQVNNPATSTGGSVVVKAKVFTSPEF